MGAQIVDTDTAIAAPTAAMLAAAGVVGVVRYLSRATPNHPGDLSAAETAAIIGAGLGLMAVQHAAPPRRWWPEAALGTAQGRAAAANAHDAGLSAGTTLWLDFEETAPGATAADAIDYCNAWTREVIAGGFEPGLYVGPNQPLSGEDLYWRLALKIYWRSAAIVPDVPARGYAMRQSAPRQLAGIIVDQDVVLGDAFGNRPHWSVISNP
ncbi:MAG TPA: glycoside hydrolase domain-containing protein [Stellaceae bacterium]|nr:glycoside hydrolase domain-containing protein [Stellaceae bacterium]